MGEAAPVSKHIQKSLVGESVARREDDRFLRGLGQYLADMPAQAQIAIVRSSEASAWILGIEVAEAVATPGVLAVLTANDLDLAKNRIDILTTPEPAFAEAASFHMAEQVIPVLATECVTYVGQPIAVVVARDRYCAEDGAELVRVKYKTRPVVIDARDALKPGSPMVHSGGTNEAAHIKIEFGSGELQVPQSAVTVAGTYSMGRHGAVPLETRGVRARWDSRSDRVEVWTSTQIPHMVRGAICESLGVSKDKVRVSVPDVGGGFGQKANVYAEEVVVAAVARKTGLDVAWVEDRLENLTAAAQGRDQVHDARLVVDSEGLILHWQDDFVVDIGSGSLWVGGIIANTAVHLMGPYRVPSAKLTGRAAFTNKCIVAQYRGAGRPEAAFALERSLDAAAAALNLTPEEIRRRNLLSAEDMPYSRPLPYRDGVPISYDGGDFRACLEAVLELLPRSQAAAYALANPELKVGYGLSSYIEATGRGPWEAGRIRLDATTGRFVAATGAASAGMSHETSFAQVAADGLEVPFDHIKYERTDTDGIAHGVGSFASRSAVLAGSALHLAAKEVVKRGTAFVSQVFNVDLSDVTYGAGEFRVSGKKMTWQDIAVAISPGGSGESLSVTFDVTHIYRPRTVTWTMGVHAAIVGVHPSSGLVRVLDYAVAHEGGAEINPKVVAGQIMGGVAQGIGGALLEEFEYGKNGEPLSTTLFGYHLAGANEVPPVRIKHLSVPTPDNPIGVRGAGESGTIAAYATVASAVDDAVGGGFHVQSTPISPAVVRRAIVRNSPSVARRVLVRNGARS